jgi:hypothetical protein
MALWLTERDVFYNLGMLIDMRVMCFCQVLLLLLLLLRQDRILVFHRGIGTERVTGLLIDQKLDLLMDYTGAC